MTVAVCPELEALRYEYDADNRLQRVMGYIDGETVYQFTYDENGNRIEKRDGSGALLESYVYDAKNRLVELDAGGQVTHYEYDPYDYRISQETNGEKMLYFLDGENIESIYDGRGKPKATFLRGAVTDEIIAAYHYDDRGQRQFYTYFHDGVTSVTALADHTGAIKQTYTYSPFGQDLASTGSTPNTLKYTGREQDPSGLYYYRARYYDPSVRRFLSEDPLGFDAGINFYAYAENSPFRFNDSSGLDFFYYGVQVDGGRTGGALRIAVAHDPDGHWWNPNDYYVLTTEALGGHGGIDYSVQAVGGYSTARTPSDVAGPSGVVGSSVGEGRVAGIDIVIGKTPSGVEYQNYEGGVGYGGGLPGKSPWIRGDHTGGDTAAVYGQCARDRCAPGTAETLSTPEALRAEVFSIRRRGLGTSAMHHQQVTVVGFGKEYAARVEYHESFGGEVRRAREKRWGGGAARNGKRGSVQAERWCAPRPLELDMALRLSSGEPRPSCRHSRLLALLLRLQPDLVPYDRSGPLLQGTRD